MKSIKVKSMLFALVLLFAMSACTQKGSETTAASNSDSTAKAKADSIDNADLKDVLDAARK